jgi:hypothetical protein
MLSGMTGRGVEVTTNHEAPHYPSIIPYTFNLDFIKHLVIRFQLKKGAFYFKTLSKTASAVQDQR